MESKDQLLEQITEYQEEVLYKNFIELFHFYR